MIAIVIGYTSPGSQGEFEILYSGRDATAANEASLNPPPGYLRTEMFKNPAPHRRRFHVKQEPEPEQEPEDAPRRKK